MGCHPERSEGSLRVRLRDSSVAALPQDDSFFSLLTSHFFYRYIPFQVGVAFQSRDIVRDEAVRLLPGKILGVPDLAAEGGQEIGGVELDVVEHLCHRVTMH